MSRRGCNFAAGLEAMKAKQREAIDRRLDVLRWALAGGELVRASEIAERHGYSLRTVHRDLARLRREGVPVKSEAGSGSMLMLKRPRP